MPTFYTKTISSILEPVAQQVSLLVILHEEAESGVIIPNLTSPIGVVKDAVNNLTRIGSQTYQISKDEILKKDMPTALRRVEEASEDLEHAARILATDQSSVAARKKLIEGSRGILQGTSAVLVVYDMSEVRKIIGTCNNVKQFLNLVENICTMDQLALFIKNLTPQLTAMTKLTIARAEELTVKTHADILTQSIDQIKNGIPLLLSSLKMLIINNENQVCKNPISTDECKTNRNYSVLKLLEYIQEIIRVLQMTGESESSWWENERYNNIREAKTKIESRSGLIEHWLSISQCPNSSLYEAAVIDVLDDLETISKNTTDQNLANNLNSNIVELKNLHSKATEFGRKGEGSSSSAVNVKHQFQHKLDTSKALCEELLTKDTFDSNLLIARTIDGRLAQARMWLASPEGAQKAIGYAACRSLVDDANQTKDILLLSNKNSNLIDDLVKTSDSVYKKSDLLNNLATEGKSKSSEGFQLTHDLLGDLNKLKVHLNNGIMAQVADNFIDLKSAIRKLSDSSHASVNEPKRNENFNNAAQEFLDQGTAVCRTANLVSATLGDIQQIASLKVLNDEINQLTSQVVSAGKVVLMNGGDSCPQPIKDHFSSMKTDWESRVEKLTNEIDKLTDISAFVQAQESAIDFESEKMEFSINNKSASGIVENTSNIARRANRIAQKAEIELSQNEDPVYVDNLEKSVTQLRHTITPMAMAAKTLMTNINDPLNANDWRKQNDQLRNAVKSVKLVVSPQLAEVAESVHSLSISTTESKSDADADDHFDYPEAQPNQPILAAAHVLHSEARQWSSKDNEIVAAAKRMANLMAKLSQLVRGENGSKKELIDVAKEIAQASEDVTRCARKLGEACTDIRIKNNLLQICDRIPTIGTQLRILSTVKATMIGTQEENDEISEVLTSVTQDESELNCGSDEDQEATEMLVGNAQNLMQSVVETVHAAEAASIKLRVDSGYKIRWAKRTPWYQTKQI